MKRALLSLVFGLSVIFVSAQSVSRSMVITEDATGTWCTYCPGAAMGCDDLLSHGKFVAVIANHNGDAYANAYSNARNTFYNVSAFPSVGMDGVQGYVGGNHTTSLYSSYLPMYNTRIADPSPVSMSIVVTNTGLAYTAVVTLTKVGTITATSLALHFVVTQSHVTQNWQGQTHLEHINRLMVPSQSGTTVSFTSGDVQTVTLNFNMDPTWPLTDCEFVTFLQNMDAGQGTQAGTAGYPLKKYAVLNGIKRGTIDLVPDFTVVSTNILCFTPITFTNATTGGYIGVPETYVWHFQGGSPETSTDQNPVVSYSTPGIFDVTMIVNRGGQIDTLVKPAYITANYAVGMQENQNVVATKVTPNPCHGTFTLDIFSGKPVTVNISILNSIGTAVYRENSVSVPGRFNRNITPDNITQGIYFVVVEHEGNKIVKKLVVN